MNNIIPLLMNDNCILLKLYTLYLTYKHINYIKMYTFITHHNLCQASILITVNKNYKQISNKKKLIIKTKESISWLSPTTRGGGIFIIFELFVHVAMQVCNRLNRLTLWLFYQWWLLFIMLYYVVRKIEKNMFKMK